MTRWTGLSRVADSSFLIACFDERDPRRPRALGWLADPATIVVPPEVAGETLGVLHHRKGRAAALAVFDALSKLPHLRFADDTSTMEISVLFSAKKSGLTWVDCAVVWRARKNKWVALAFDPELERAAENDGS